MSKQQIEPKPWNPPAAPRLEGPFSPNTVLESLELWPVPGEGPEDVTFDDAGNVYTGVEDGRILRFGPDGAGPEVVARVGGRPLGIEHDPRGGLVVCSDRVGLLHVDPDDGAVATIVGEVDGEPFRFCNNAAVTSDGARIYFSESSQRHDYAGTMAEIYEHSGTGRLFVHDRDAAETTVLLEGLKFANGVALARDESSVLVAELAGYRILRMQLDDEAVDTFVDNLPGMPDNLNAAESGVIWVALVNPRNALLDRILPYPKIRKWVWKIPEPLQIPPTKYGFVLGLDQDGHVVHNLQGPSGNAYSRITSAVERDGHLYLGSHEESAVGRVRIPT